MVLTLLPWLVWAALLEPITVAAQLLALHCRFKPSWDCAVFFAQDSFLLCQLAAPALVGVEDVFA